MMDSQKNALQEAKEVTAAENVAAEVNEQTETVTQETPDAETGKPKYTTKEEILARLHELATGEEVPEKAEVEMLKAVFYKIHLTEREAQQREYIEAGGDPDKYTVLPDEAEETFKAEMVIVKEKRQEAFAKQEEEKNKNLTLKRDIIEKIKAMAATPEEANKNYQEFKELQQQWKEIKAVPADKANDLWKDYQFSVEQFYDQLKLNIEAREYDCRKNLEAKTAICEAAERLAEEEDVVSAFHQLQDLHVQYRETGPVAKELREQIWARFKAASTVVNKRHQQYFEELKAKEEDNLNRKTALCEKVEEILTLNIEGGSKWEELTKEIIEIQKEWKTIGFAPQKMNVKIFERFREACDKFFNSKSEYFKALKARLADNAAKKQQLIERAKELCESTEWKETADKLIALQKEWKTIGAAPKKVSDQLWEEFNGLCNKFFDARNAAQSGTRNEEKANLEKKRDVISRLEALIGSDEEGIHDKAQALAEEFSKIGHVPFKDKDKIYKKYRETLDKIYKQLNITSARRRLDKFKTNIKSMAEKGADAVDNERARLMRRYEQLKQEIITYENNLGFLNASSKKGNSLVDEMNRRVQKLKDDMELVKQKIKTIDKECE